MANSDPNPDDGDIVINFLIKYFRALMKGALSVRNFKKCIFSIILYIKVEHLENVVLKFQDGWSKIKRARAFESPVHPTFRETLENFKRVYLKITFLKSVNTISQKLIHRSV